MGRAAPSGLFVAPGDIGLAAASFTAPRLPGPGSRWACSPRVLCWWRSSPETVGEKIAAAPRPLPIGRRLRPLASSRCCPDGHPFAAAGLAGRGSRSTIGSPRSGPCRSPPVRQGPGRPGGRSVRMDQDTAIGLLAAAPLGWLFNGAPEARSSRPSWCRRRCRRIGRRVSRAARGAGAGVRLSALAFLLGVCRCSSCRPARWPGRRP